MWFGVLGRLEVRRPDGTELPVAGPARRQVLAALLCRCGAVVPAATLIEDLWGPAPPRSAVASLRSHVMRLRGDLALGTDVDVLVTVGDGYRLRLDVADVDAARFEALVGAASGDADPCTAMDRYDEALALWRGDPYEEFGDAPFAVLERIRLTELRAAARERRTELALAAGVTDELIGDLELRVRTEPYRERGWEQLALVLYRSGRQADALGACRRARQVLLDDLGVDPNPGLAALEQRLLRHDPDLSGPARQPAPLSVITRCPYLGLAGYDEQDAPLFVGRERLTSRLAGGVADQSVVVVTGPSGVGKSSLVRAGLVPALRAGALPGSSAWRVDVRTPTSDVLDDEQRRPDLLVLDQAEELFTTLDDETRTGLLARLAAYVEHDQGRVVLVLRSDFYGRLTEIEWLAPFAQKTTLLVGPMRADEMRRALVEPAAAAGLRLEDELLETIMDDAAGQPEPLPMLSEAMVGTWQRRQGTVLTLEAYRAAGELSGAIEAAAETCFSQMNEAQRLAARRLLVRMATRSSTGWTRRAVVRSDDADDAEQQALALLISARLVVADEERVEVSHDALLRHWSRLRDWLEERSVAAELLQHLGRAASEWRTTGRNDTDLYRGPRLVAAIEWRTVHPEDLSDGEVEFVDRSAQAADAELEAERRGRRNTRRVAVVLAAVLVLAVAGGILAVRERGTANKQALRARQAALTADARRLAALSTTAPDIATSSLLAVAAYRLQDSAGSRGALLDAVERNQSALWQLRLAQRPQRMVGTPDGSLLATNDNRTQTTITLIDPRTRRRVATVAAGDNEGQLVGVTPAGRQVITFGPTNAANPVGRLAVYAVPGGRERVLTDAGDLNAPIPAMSSDGRWVAVVTSQSGGSGEVVDVFDSRDWSAPPMRFVTAGEPIAIAAGRSALALESAYGAVEVRSLPGLRVVGRLPAMTTTPLIPVEFLAGNTGRLAVSPDGRTVARVDARNANVVALYQLGSAAGPGTPLPAQAAAVRTLAFAPDGSQLAVGSQSGSLATYPTKGAGQSLTLPGHSGHVNGIVWSGDSVPTGLYSAGQDGEVISWAVDRKPRLVSQSGADRLPPVSATRFGSVVVGGAQLPDTPNSQRELFTVDMATGSYAHWPALLSDDDGIDQIVASDHGGRALVSIVGAGGNRIMIVDLQAHRNVGQLALPPGTDRSFVDGLSAAISGDGQRAYCSLDRSRIGVFALPSGRYLRSFTVAFADPDGGRIEVVPWQFDPAGRLVVAGLDPGPSGVPWAKNYPALPPDARLGLVDASSLKLVGQTRLGDIGAPSALSWTGDGGTLALGTSDGTLGLYDAESLALRASAGIAASGPVNTLGFAPDDRTLVLGSGDASLWSVPDLVREARPVQLGDSQGGSAVWAWYGPGGDIVGLAEDASQLGAGTRWFTLTVQPSTLTKVACQLAGSDMTRAQWQRYLGDRPYRHVCS